MENINKDDLNFPSFKSFDLGLILGGLVTNQLVNQLKLTIHQKLVQGRCVFHNFECNYQQIKYQTTNYQNVLIVTKSQAIEIIGAPMDICVV